jgi:hypothetical protein
VGVLGHEVGGGHAADIDIVEVELVEDDILAALRWERVAKIAGTLEGHALLVASADILINTVLIGCAAVGDGKLHTLLVIGVIVILFTGRHRHTKRLLAITEVIKDTCAISVDFAREGTFVHLGDIDLGNVRIWHVNLIRRVHGCVLVVHGILQVNWHNGIPKITRQPGIEVHRDIPSIRHIHHVRLRNGVGAATGQDNCGKN